MNNWVILPLLIPLLSGLLLAVFRQNRLFQRGVSLISILLILAVSLQLARLVFREGVQTLQLGGWQAPFGITLAADMFSVLLVITAALVSFACLLFAISSIGPERELFYFYPLVQFLLAGVNGSFLTGDLFNLFVCFEVMLLSSYVLLSLGGTKFQLRESIHYVLINVVSSTLFLVSIAYLYAMTGTLNMAHLSVRIADAGVNPLLTLVAVLLLIVFSLKSALFFFFWLPGAYSAPPPAVAAIFAALLTKVGIYAIFRVFTLVFYSQPVVFILIGFMAGATMLLGGIGAVAHWDIRKILAYNVILSVGFIVSGLVAFSHGAMMGAAFYLVHDMIVKALLFLTGGIIIIVAGTSKLKEISGLIRNHPLLGWIFFIAVLALAGVPPLSGFAGKLQVLQELILKGSSHSGYYWLAGIGLLSSLMALYSTMKIFSNAFWGETPLSEEMERGTAKGLILPCVFLTVLSIALGLGAEYLYPLLNQAAAALMDPRIYIEAVLSSVH